MKKYILTTVVALLLLGTQNSFARIIFSPINLGGMPGTFGGCFGHGFCRSTTPMDILTQLNSSPDGTVTLSVNTTNFSPENQDFYRNLNTFDLPSDFPLQPDECNGLGLEPGTFLKAGSYPIIRQGDLFLITIPASE